MLLNTRLKAVGTGVHFLWFLLIGIVIISSEPVRAHAPPRAMYYGHRVEPREPFKHMPSSLLFGGEPFLARDRLYDMPTCSQLRNMWKSSIRNLKDNNVMNNINNNLDSNEIPVILNNPYYMAFLWHQSLQHSRPHFGKVETEPTVTTQASANEDRGQPLHHHSGKSLSQKSSVREDVPPIPGHFMDKPSKIGVVYGHVIHSPDEAEERRQVVNVDKHRYRDRDGGAFGDFATQVDDSSESNGRSNENNNNDNNLKQSSTVKQQRTGNSNSFSQADDFFKSGVWHENPVIPSVSFQRFH